MRGVVGKGREQKEKGRGEDVNFALQTVLYALIPSLLTNQQQCRQQHYVFHLVH